MTKINLTESESRKILQDYQIPGAPQIAASNLSEAVTAAKQIGFPVVLKGSGPLIPHKTEKGLVFLNLSNSKEVEKAALKILKTGGSDLKEIIVQSQIKGTREFVAGMFRDKNFGPLIMFGLGGIFTESLSDIVFKVAPITKNDAEDMLESIKAKALLGEFRGQKPVSKDILIKILMGLSKLSIERKDISEVDINPLIATESGELFAADALVVLGEEIEIQHREAIDPLLIKPLFYPKSIAIIGASKQAGKWGNRLAVHILSREYQGKVFLVNPKGGKLGPHKIYKSIDQIPGPVDMAVVTIPAKFVIDLIPQLAEKSIKSMLLISSGFGETGQEGKKLEQCLVKKAKKAGILILGPNTMGICNPHINLYAMGISVEPKAGATAFVSQSGNMGMQLLAFAQQNKIGIRGFAGSGNEAMITVEDYMEGLEKDELTRVIMLYIESVKNGPRFFKSALRISKKKPIILLKGGQSSPGNRAASSHTGSMAVDSKVFNTVCRQAGIVKVNHSIELLDLSAAFSSLPLPRGNRAAIMTLGGGWGVVTADLCSKKGLIVPKLAHEIIEDIDKILPPYWSRTNPVDVVGEADPKIPMLITEKLLQWKQIDGIIILGVIGRRFFVAETLKAIMKVSDELSGKQAKEIKLALDEAENKYIENIAILMEKYQKPVFGVGLLKDRNIPSLYKIKNCKFKTILYETPERAVNVFARMYEYRRHLDVLEK